MLELPNSVSKVSDSGLEISYCMLKPCSLYLAMDFIYKIISIDGLGINKTLSIDIVIKFLVRVVKMVVHSQKLCQSKESHLCART